MKNSLSLLVSLVSLFGTAQAESLHTYFGSSVQAEILPTYRCSVRLGFESRGVIDNQFQLSDLTVIADGSLYVFKDKENEGPAILISIDGSQVDPHSEFFGTREVNAYVVPNSRFVNNGVTARQVREISNKSSFIQNMKSNDQTFSIHSLTLDGLDFELNCEKESDAI